MKSKQLVRRSASRNTTRDQYLIGQDCTIFRASRIDFVEVAAKQSDEGEEGVYDYQVVAQLIGGKRVVLCVKYTQIQAERTARVLYDYLAGGYSAVGPELKMAMKVFNRRAEE